MATVNVIVDGSGTALMRSSDRPVRGREEAQSDAPGAANLKA